MSLRKMLFSTPIFFFNHEMGQDPERYSLILAVWVCATPKGKIFGPFGLKTLCPYERIYCFNSK